MGGWGGTAPRTCSCHKSAENNCKTPETCSHKLCCHTKSIDELASPTTDVGKQKHTNFGFTPREHYLNKPCWCTATADTSDWRERFDEEFNAHKRVLIVPALDALKAFISKEIERAREEGKMGMYPIAKEDTQATFEAGRTARTAEVREIMKGMHRVEGSGGYTNIEPYNQALTDLLVRIQ